MKPLKIKIITGFRKDQHYTIDADEAHKAYYLFLHPEQRGIFKNGVAIIGQHIHGIEPDYHATMGWYPDHTLDSEDYKEMRLLGVDKELQSLLQLAKDVATRMPDKINLPLSEIKLLS